VDYKRYVSQVTSQLAARDFAVAGGPEAKFSLLMERDESWGRLVVALPAAPASDDVPVAEGLVSAAAAWVEEHQHRAGRPCHLLLVFPFARRVPDRLSEHIGAMRREGPDGRWSVLPWTADLEIGLVDQHLGPPRVDPKLAVVLTELPEPARPEAPWRTGGAPPVRLPGLKLDLGAVPVTRLILAFTIAYFLWTLLFPVGKSDMLILSLLNGPGRDTLIRYGANHGFLVLAEQEQWRLLSHVLLHGGLIHLGFNMWALWALGRHVELIYGSGRLLYVYIFAGFAGGFASAVIRPDAVLSVGASGAIFGLLGALLYFAWSGRTIDWRSLMGPIVINLMFGFFWAGIDQYAHVGGLIGGIIAGFLVGTPGQRTAWRTAAMALSFALIALVISGLLPLSGL